MKCKYKIGIWGQFSNGIKIADGQAVRTTVITNELKKRYGSECVSIVNTYSWKKHPISFFLNTVKLIRDCQKIVIFPADNGFKMVVPIYDFFNRFYKRELYDVVIGGYLPKLLSENPKYITMLQKYKALFVQTPSLKKDIENNQLNNVHILSNLKRLNTRSESDISIRYDKEISVCTLSRINQDKGIEDAFKAVKMANDILGATYIKLHLYGMIQEDYRMRFTKLLEENKNFSKYCGIADYDKTVETLSPYFALLFPTYYYGEGFPGNVVDAYNTGLPIIATDWMYNKDIILDEYNGILVPVHDSKSICDALLKLYNDREYHYQITINNLKEAAKYKPDTVLKEFYDYMDKE